MIPKIIHLCWLSGDPYPPIIQACLDTWKEQLPDYEIMLWDRNRFDVDSTPWTSEAFGARKYAFAADYIRLYALYNYGGIYLDSDVVVYKSFDDLLGLPYFIGQDYMGFFEAAVIGAEKGTPWIGEILDRYKDRHFIAPDGAMDTQSLPYVFNDVLTPRYRYRRIDSLVDYKLEKDVISVFNRDFFNSRDSMAVRRTPRSYCAHNYAATWVKRTGWKWRVRSMLPLWLMRRYFNFAHCTFRRSRVTGGLRFDE